MGLDLIFSIIIVVFASCHLGRVDHGDISLEVSSYLPSVCVFVFLILGHYFPYVSEWTFRC